MKLFLLFCGFALGLAAQPWSGILDPARAVDWSGAGVTGGIPTDRTQCVNAQCQTVTTNGASSTAAQINAALANAPANTYVLLPAGTYSLSAGILINRSNVTLRGAGADQTLINFSGSVGCFMRNALICAKSSSSNYNYGPENLANWTAGYARGTTQITLDGHANLKVGTPMVLDQANDASDDGTIYICNTGAACAQSGPSGFERSGRGQIQVVTVASCGGSTTYGTACTSNTVTISPGIYMQNWRSGQSPQAWWSSTPITGVGIENLSINEGSVDANSILTMNLTESWIKGVRSLRGTIYAYNKHFSTYIGTHITWRDNYLYGPGGQNTSYGMEFAPANDSLVENNIIQAVAEPLTPSSSNSGCVYSYNFSANQKFPVNTIWQNQQLMLHSVIDNLLYEGNVGVGMYSDNFHGTHHFNTAFRNRMDGYESNDGTNPSQHTDPVILFPYNRYFNIVGNVLGSTARHNRYESVLPADPKDRSIYINGYNDQGGSSVDSPTQVSLMRWGNYDIVTGATRWCTGSGAPSAFCTGNERGDTSASYPALASPSQTLPNSFFRTAQPSWWPSSVGGVTTPYPPIGPDITSGNIGQCSGGTYAGYQALTAGQCTGGTLTASIAGGHAYAIPAMAAYFQMGGNPVGTNAALTFNADTLYGAAVSSAPTVSTTAATGIGTTTATAGGNVTTDGGAAVTVRGTCYATTPNPTAPCTSDGSGTGSFTSSLSGLLSGTLYHIRAFATNSVGTSYGSDLTFTTNNASSSVSSIFQGGISSGVLR